MGRGRRTGLLASVVIPAHNEELVLGASLAALLGDAEPGELDVIVVANACTDGTAAVARALDGVRVVETSRAGKASALCLGDAECAGFPRLYLDADVRISASSVREMVSALKSRNALACAPGVEWDIDNCSPAARHAHRVHEALVAPQRVLAGVGAYMLTEVAHRRVFPMPEIIADDEWVHRHFDPSERCTVERARSATCPPPTVSGMVRRRARARAGNRELDSRSLRSTSPPLALADLVRVVRSRRVTPVDAVCFVGVLLADRVVTTWRELARGGAVWSVERRMAGKRAG